MLGVALTLFAVAALGGITMAVLRLRGMPRPPLWLALAHGLVAAAGFGFLIYEAVSVGLGSLALIALVVLVLAALGGSVLFLGFDLRGKELPVAFVFAHGLIALTGFMLLAVYHYKMHEWGLRP
jgi:hypothetical protein